VVLEPLLQGFAAFGSVIGLGGGVFAFSEWVENGMNSDNPQIGQALDLGIAVAFVPALAAGLAAFSHASTL
jgi:hypothetical protein